MATRGQVTITTEGDCVLVSSVELRRDRIARMFFESVLGGVPTENGWRCPRRRNPISVLIVRINTFLENKGWAVDRSAVADDAVQREIERKRSYERTKDRATALREGTTTVDPAQVKATLRDFGWNADARTLREHQERGLIHALTAINAANFSVPGAGKTAVALAVAATHISSGTVDVVLVVGPLSAFRPWEKEAIAATRGRISPKRVRGTGGQRRSAYASVHRGQLLLVSYATAAADRLALIELCRAHKVMLVVDESHRIKRFRGGFWAPALLEIARHARVRLILSGTPMPQSGRDLYTQLNVLWPAGELTGPRDTFAAQVDRNFAAVLRDIQPFISRTPKAALGLPAYLVTVHRAEMIGTQAEIYGLIESNFRKRIEDASTWQDKLDALRRGRPIRLLQAASNPDALNAHDTQYRLPRLVSANPTLMERLAAYGALEVPAKTRLGLELTRKIVESGQKVVCWSNFLPNLDDFARLVRGSVAAPVFQVDGRVPAGDETDFDDPAAARANPDDADTRERVIDQFLGSAGPAVLVTNPASCSESISLHTTCRNAIYLDRTFDCALFLQSIDRIHRLGLPPDAVVNIHIILASNSGRPTIDDVVHQALLRKEASMRQLLEGAELRPFDLAVDPLLAAEGDDEDLAALLRFLLGEE